MPNFILFLSDKMVYATYEDVIAYDSLSDFTQTAVENMISWAETMVERQAGTKFVSSSGSDTFYGDGWSKRFQLTHRPLINVISAVEYDDNDDSTESKTIAHTIGDSGFVVLDTAVSSGNYVVFTYNYGDTDNSELAKLATIFLTLAGLQFMKEKGGIRPINSARIGDLQYSIQNGRARNYLMNATAIVQSISRKEPQIIGRDGYHESLR